VAAEGSTDDKTSPRGWTCARACVKSGDGTIFIYHNRTRNDGWQTESDDDDEDDDEDDDDEDDDDDDMNRLHNATTTVPRRPADCLRRAELDARTVCTFRGRSSAHARTPHSHRNYTGLSGLLAATTTP